VDYACFMAVIARDDGSPQSVAGQSAQPQARPGSVFELVIAALASSNEPQRPQDVMRRAEQMHGRSASAIVHPKRAPRDEQSQGASAV